MVSWIVVLVALIFTTLESITQLWILLPIHFGTECWKIVQMLLFIKQWNMIAFSSLVVAISRTVLKFYN